MMIAVKIAYSWCEELAHGRVTLKNDTTLHCEQPTSSSSGGYLVADPVRVKQQICNSAGCGKSTEGAVEKADGNPR